MCIVSLRGGMNRTLFQRPDVQGKLYKGRGS